MATYCFYFEDEIWPVAEGSAPPNDPSALSAMFGPWVFTEWWCNLVDVDDREPRSLPPTGPLGEPSDDGNICTREYGTAVHQAYLTGKQDDLH